MLCSLFWYQCQECDYEESGTRSFVFDPRDFERDMTETEVVIRWSGTLASPRELLALRKVAEDLQPLSSPALKRRVSFRPKWSLGIFPTPVARELAAKAASLGLLVDLKEQTAKT